DAQYQYAATFERLAAIVQPIRQLAQHILGHRTVYLTGQFDKACVQAILSRFPSQVEGVNRDAMTTQAGARIVSGEAKWLGGSSIYYFKDVDAHAVRNDFHFVDQANVDGTVNVLQQLGHFRCLGRADRHHLVDGLLIKRDADIQASRCMTADHFRNGTVSKLGLPGSSRSGE